MIVVDLMVGIGIELANATCDQENYCYTTKPPSYGDARGETRHDKEDGSYDVADDG